MYGVTCLCEEGVDKSCTLLGWAKPKNSHGEVATKPFLEGQMDAA